MGRPTLTDEQRAQVDRQFAQDERRARARALKGAETRRARAGLETLPTKRVPPARVCSEEVAREIAVTTMALAQSLRPLPALRSGVYLLLHRGDVVWVGGGRNIERKLLSDASTRIFDDFRYSPLGVGATAATHEEMVAALVRVLRPRYNLRAAGAILTPTARDLELVRQLCTAPNY